MGCIPSRESTPEVQEHPVVADSGSGATRRPVVHIASKPNDGSKMRTTSIGGIPKSSYTQSVKQLVKEGLVMQPEFEAQLQSHSQGHTPTKGDGGSTPERLPKSNGLPRDISGFMRLSDEERANRRRDMAVTFRTPSAYPDLGSLFSSKKVTVEDLTWDLGKRAP